MSGKRQKRTNTGGKIRDVEKGHPDKLSWLGGLRAHGQNGAGKASKDAKLERKEKEKNSIFGYFCWDLFDRLI